MPLTTRAFDATMRRYCCAAMRDICAPTRAAPCDIFLRVAARLSPRASNTVIRVCCAVCYARPLRAAYATMQLLTRGREEMLPPHAVARAQACASARAFSFDMPPPAKNIRDAVSRPPSPMLRRYFRYCAPLAAMMTLAYQITLDTLR